MDDMPDIGLNDDETMCPTTGYTYLTESTCPHHYDGSENCND